MQWRARRPGNHGEYGINVVLYPLTSFPQNTPDFASPFRSTNLPDQPVQRAGVLRNFAIPDALRRGVRAIERSRRLAVIELSALTDGASTLSGCLPTSAT